MAHIVWLASYPKYGNTWLRALLCNFIADAGRPLRLADLWRYAADESKPNWYLPYSGGRDPGELSALETAALRTRVARDIAAAARNELVLVKTHSYFGSLEAHRLQELELTAGALYIVRNPLDVVPSMADHFGVGLDEAIDFLANEMTGTPGDEANVASVLCSWSTHVLSWCQSRLARLQVIRYEDLLDNGPATLAKVTRFLAMGHDPARIECAIRSSSVEELRRQEASEGFAERSPNSQRFFSRGLKNRQREALSPEQVARIVECHRPLMTQFGLRREADSAATMPMSISAVASCLSQSPHPPIDAAGARELVGSEGCALDRRRIAR